MAIWPFSLFSRFDFGRRKNVRFDSCPTLLHNLKMNNKKNCFMRLTFAFYFTFLLVLTQSATAAEPAFEAYYKFFLGEQHSGYVVQRLDVEPKTNHLTSIYYVYVKTPSGSTTESLVAKADANFEPISFQYTALVDSMIKTAEGTFKNKKMVGKMRDGQKTQNISLTTPPNGFLSTFLNYVILKNGMMVGKNYGFTALAEESPACFAGDPDCNKNGVGFMPGTAAVVEELKYKNIPAYKIKFKYKEIGFTGEKLEFDGIISSTGETLASLSPKQNARTEIVLTKEEAVGGFPFSEKNIRLIFGNVPTGKKNALHNASASASTGAAAKPMAPTQAKPVTENQALTPPPQPVTITPPGQTKKIGQ